MKYVRNINSAFPESAILSKNYKLGFQPHRWRCAVGKWSKLNLPCSSSSLALPSEPSLHYCLKYTHSPPPPSVAVEKLSSMKLVPRAIKVGDCCDNAHSNEKIVMSNFSLPRFISNEFLFPSDYWHLFLTFPGFWSILADHNIESQYILKLSNTHFIDLSIALNISWV